MSGSSRPVLLIVDHSSADRLLYRRLLKADGEYFDIVETDAPEKGLRLAAERSPACIFVDQNLAGMTGIEFIRELRRSNDTVAVVMLTAQDNAEVSVEALKQGADDFMVKGRVTSELLRHAVRNAIEKHALGGQVTRQSQQLHLMQLLLEQSDDILLVIRPDTAELVEASAGGLASLGYRREALVDSDLRHCGLLDGDEDWRRFLGRARASRGPFDWRLLTAQGEPLPVEVRAKFVVVGATPYLMVVARDCSQRKQYEEQLRDLSQIDGLTGVQNRRGFDSRLLQEWARAAQARRPVGLLLLDVDHFKKYNDHLGHPAGDECLRRIAGALRQSLVRGSDSVARYGGEEFAVLLGDADLDSALHIGERMLQAVRELALPHPASSAGPHVTASIGCAARIPAVDVAPQNLVSAADAALYRAKQTGRNRVEAEA